MLQNGALQGNIKLDNVVVYFTVGFATAATVCPDGWVGHTGSCYFFSPTPAHFTEAEVQSNHFTFFRCSSAVLNMVQDMCVV